MAFDLSVLNRVYNFVWAPQSVNRAFPARLIWRICKINFVCTPSKQKPITWICAIAIANTGFKTGQRSFFLCPKQGNKVVVVAFSRVCILEFFCPKPGQGFKPSATHPYSNIGPVPPRTGPSRALGTRLFPPPRENCKTNCTFLLPDLTYVNRFEWHLNYRSVCNILFELLLFAELLEFKATTTSWSFKMAPSQSWPEFKLKKKQTILATAFAS